MTNTPQRIFRKDYRPPDYLVDSIALAFDIHAGRTQVTARAHYRRNPAAGSGPAPLVLMGRELKLLSIALDGKDLPSPDYALAPESLTVADVPAFFALEIVTEIHPGKNTALEGLYASGPMLCTQCEAEGFRRITFYPDRPDVLARFSVSIEADAGKYPVLLSNGNLVSREDAGNGRRRVTWEDPFPKPCYLFALVAGDLAVREDEFIRASGRPVKLQIYCEPGKEDQLDQAMDALKSSMRWDEQRFGREYDLDQFMIVATPFFNSGAMENKGLNIFNAAYVLGRSGTATDTDLQNIEAVVAHEYFHNWSGNRVTCRDWFQLSLKEGFTVFREQEYCRAMHSPVTERIEQVRLLRNHQFVEDSGPMAHAVRPDSYLTIDNFYTTTVYEKGGEVIRMMQTLFGVDGFRKGSDLYFERHDGQAVTCDDFARAIWDANPGNPHPVDLEHFKLWYAQAGTPRVKAESRYDEREKRFTLRLSQSLPLPPGQTDKKPMVIPVDTGLLGRDGQDIPGAARLLVLKQASEEFVFDNIPEKPAVSLLRHFSAPVALEYAQDEDGLAFLMRHDSDLFNRWEAAQKLAALELLRSVESAAGVGSVYSEKLVAAFGAVLDDAARDADFTALCLTLPGEAELGQALLRMGEKIDIDAVHAAREGLRKALAVRHRPAFEDIYKQGLALDPLATDGASAGRRRLKNLSLAYLALLEDAAMERLAFNQSVNARNMTDAVAALSALAHRAGLLREKAFDDFHDKWRNEELVIDKWLALQAAADRPGAVEDVLELMKHPAFSIANPNRVHALIGHFCANLSHFHRKDGKGYRLLADVILQLDPLNPQLAGRRLQPLTRWRYYAEDRASLMRAELSRILATPDLSKNTLEVAQSALEDDPASN